MKKILFLFAVTFFLFSSCSKYKDGPDFSLYSKTHRLCNTWVISQATETANGVTTDKTTDYKTYYYEFEITMYKNNGYTLDYLAFNLISYTESGTWVYNGDKTHVFFTKTSSAPGSGLGTDWTILKLKEKELWGSYVTNGTVVEIHFVPRFS